MTLPAHPTTRTVKSCLKKWRTLDNYVLQERSLSKLFNDLCPNNLIIEDVLLKVSALNDFYSTNIFDTFTVSKHILDCRIDEDLKNGDIALVGKIAPVSIGGKTRNLYSFASKYCSHHNPEAYPIYDSYVEKVLMYFKKEDDLKDYGKFIEVMKRFKKFYDLEDFTIREIDIYLWLTGKRFFPNKYYGGNKRN